MVLLSGKFVRFTAPVDEPQGALLSYAAPQRRSGGHMKAAGPISVLASSP